MLQYFTPQGRIGRSGYWRAELINLFGAASLGLGLAAAWSERDWLLALLLAVPAAVAAWCLFCVHVKRLHDLGKSAWWALLPFVPGVGPLWAFVECGFFAGNPGFNRYGPPPGVGGAWGAGTARDDPALDAALTVASWLKSKLPVKAAAPSPAKPTVSPAWAATARLAPRRPPPARPPPGPVPPRPPGRAPDFGKKSRW